MLYNMLPKYLDDFEGVEPSPFLERTCDLDGKEVAVDVNHALSKAAKVYPSVRERAVETALRSLAAEDCCKVSV